MIDTILHYTSKVLILFNCLLSVDELRNNLTFLARAKEGASKPL